MTPDLPREPSGLLARIGLHRPELRAWAMYDWANSGFVLAIQTAIFPIWFHAQAGGEGIGTVRLAWTTTIALALVAVASPVLGALADYAGLKKRMLGTFVGIGAAATACLWFVAEGDWVTAAVLFGAANIGAQASFVFYDSLLPHIAGPREMDRVSTAGYALGYFGSTLLFVLLISWITWPEAFALGSRGTATRAAFVAVAVWWLVFTLPLLLKVPEPRPRIEPDERPGQNPFRVAFVRLGETFRELRTYRHAFLMLLAFVVYNDGIGTIIRMAGPYGKDLGFPDGALMLAILVPQIVGIPFAFMFGALAGRIGPKRAIFLGLIAYVGITSYAFFLQTLTGFFVLAAMVGVVQGGTQALSRSLFASMIPTHKSAEFFSFYGVLDKFAGMLGPMFFATTAQLTGSSRIGILSLLFFFLAGMLILSRVDVAEGRRVAREAEARLSSKP
ncbi:MAG TPA: MFS transporter [Gemmatimonadota bacterium]|nr:MFS transporter [Gemmatimonadota bacterium]